ncbi:hypothetical protein HY798_04580 [Candidatus Falkowbacteria bacterium]|nr:hypothetical protein [Candidatus Falkowbacteria bacterium]
MEEVIRHNCGLCVTYSLHDAYKFVKCLQHRGREATGIAAIGSGRIDVIKWEEEVDTFDLEDLGKILNGDYQIFFAHVRYTTRGRKDKALEDAHPHTIGGTEIKNGRHTIVLDCEMAIVHNGQVSDEYLDGVDRSLLKTGCDSEAILHFYRAKGAREILNAIPNSYVLAIADKSLNGVIVLRDGNGMKPGVLGLKGEKCCVASEDTAILDNNGKVIEEIRPGSIYHLAPNGSYTREDVVEKEEKFCFFEVNYIMESKSTVKGRVVRVIRKSLGKALAREFNFSNANLVTYIPRCPEPAAGRYAPTLGLQFEPVFYKLRGTRSFLGSTEEERKRSIDENLYLLPKMMGALTGKKIVVIDDSLIRGNNSRRAIWLLKEVAGAEDITLLSYTPPVGIVGDNKIPRGCLYGVDMPPDDNFIARERSIKEISDIMGVKVGYLSKEGMFEAFEEFGLLQGSFCSYCIGGPKI